MRILKLEIEKKDKDTFLNIELDVNGETSGYSASIYNHINRKKKINITDKFEENKGIATAQIDLKEVGIFNTTAIVLEVEDSKFVIHKGIAVDISNYFKCMIKEIIREIDKKCEECVLKHNENLIQLSVAVNAFKDAYAIGAIDELFQLAAILDKLCNSNCKNCG